MTPPPSRDALVRYFLRLGTVGFGGPAVLVERMRRDLQETRGWYTQEEFKEGLALAQLAPGPLAAQLAVYLGWARAGVPGATLVGLAFVMPSFLMVLVISALYVRYGGLPWMSGAFYGVGAAVIALIAHSAWKLARRTIGLDPLLWSVLGVNAVATAWTEREIIWLILASGVVVLIARGNLVPGFRRAANAILPLSPVLLIPDWWLAGLGAPQPMSRLLEIVWFFAKAGAVVFGSGLAIVPFLHGTVVKQNHWLTEQQFLDAIAVSMITPGPVVITVAFIGYLVAGPLGATAAALGVFLPVYLIVILVARWYRAIAKSEILRAAVDGVTAAATGAIAGAAFVLGSRALVDATTWGIFAAALAMLVFARRVPEPAIVLASAVVGLGVRGALT